MYLLGGPIIVAVDSRFGQVSFEFQHDTLAKYRLYTSCISRQSWLHLDFPILPSFPEEFETGEI